MSESHSPVTDDYGVSRWTLNGRPHRIDGPAILHSDGVQLWYKEGKLHRCDGPAVIMNDSDCSWWYEGLNYKSVHKFAKAAGWTDKQLADHILKYGDKLY